CGANMQVLSDFLGAFGFARTVDYAEIRDRAQEAETEIFTQRQIEKHPFGMAIVGNETAAGFAKRAGSVAGNPRSVDEHLAAGATVKGGGGADKLALAFAF